MVEHEYKKLKVSDLIPYVNNSRTHSENQINTTWLLSRLAYVSE